MYSEVIRTLAHRWNMSYVKMRSVVQLSEREILQEATHQATVLMLSADLYTMHTRIGAVLVEIGSLVGLPGT